MPTWHEPVTIWVRHGAELIRFGTFDSHSGVTPVPATDEWYVEPTGNVSQRMAEDMRRNQAPGVMLNDRVVTAADLDALREASFVRRLELAGAQLEAGALALVSPHITHLSLEASDVSSDEVQALLTHLRHLVALVADDTSVTDDSLRPLLHHPTLARLSLARTAVTEQSAATIASLSALVELDLSRVKASDAWVTAVVQHPLETLVWNDAALGNAARLAPLAPTLRRLELANSPMAPKDLAWLVGTRALRELNLNKTNISAATLLQLPTRHQLTKLKVAGAGLTAAQAVELLTGATSLQNVDLAETKADDRAALLLWQHPALHTVRLDMTGVTDAAFAAPLPATVRHLSLAYLPLTDAIAGALAPLPLESVSLRATKVGDATLAVLWKQLGLRDLDLGEVRATPDAWEGIANLRLLQDLRLDYSGFAAWSSLARLSALRTLHLDRTPEAPAYWARLATHHPALRELSLARVFFSDANVNGLCGLRSLRVLSLADTKITDATLSNPCLAHLIGINLAMTPVSLLEPLLSWPNLRELGLDQTSVTDESLLALRHSRIEQLSVAGNNLSVTALAHISKMPMLRWVDITGLNAKEKSVRPLLRALTQRGVVVVQ